MTKKKKVMEVMQCPTCYKGFEIDPKKDTAKCPACGWKFKR